MSNKRHLEHIEHIEWLVLLESVTICFALQSIVETEIADKHGISLNFLYQIAILVNFEGTSCENGENSVRL